VGIIKSHMGVASQPLFSRRGSKPVSCRNLGVEVLDGFINKVWSSN